MSVITQLKMLISNALLEYSDIHLPYQFKALFYCTDMFISNHMLQDFYMKKLNQLEEMNKCFLGTIIQ